MISSYAAVAISLSFSSAVFASPHAIPAVPAIQDLSRRSEYQGGFPIGLTGTNSGDCPSEAPVQCTATNLNPSCCPSGQTCFYNSWMNANYCCPTDADCLTAVENFPRCADYSWNMFIQGGLPDYFCCPPGTIATVPASGKSGGLCEPSDQVIPKSLLATMVSQVGAPTPTPTATSGATVTATATGTGTAAATTTSGAPLETNPTLSGVPGSETSSASSPSSSASSIHITKQDKLWIGLGVIGVIIFLIFCGVVAMCRRNRRMRIIEMNNNNYNAGYDRFGNALSGYPGPVGGLPGYEPYRRIDTPAPNNVTVNVVQGDLQGDGSRL